MTVQVLTEDEYIEAGTAEHAVEMMFRSTRLAQESSVAEYMRAVARRVKLWNGQKIRVGAARLFLRDLARKGLILYEVDADE